MKTPRNNPRIILTVTADNITAKGVFIDYRDNVYQFSKSFSDENQAMDYLNNMRDNENKEFSIQVNRINWK